ncbi:PilZ domain-containing protein [Sphingomonas aliaeris]|uniref:PilZ domain-containing protein n=1 Tax=Sphingomonas aliaeris TaxID=2759526 RepID=A0A974S358_9SPHN|nr:PilZ domain-containing protein [Sphingomonas aliaeris]QQV76227.1 PilZ domain-containing protein [Sphingomonas aliaeris]
MDGFQEFSGDDVAAQDNASARDTSRDSFFLMAEFREVGLPTGRHVRVRNLSTGGLMAEYAEPIALGTPVELDVRGIGWIKGSIAWVAAGRIGVSFDRKVDPKAARKPTSGAARSQKFSGPVILR